MSTLSRRRVGTAVDTEEGMVVVLWLVGILAALEGTIHIRRVPIRTRMRGSLLLRSRMGDRTEEAMV